MAKFRQRLAKRLIALRGEKTQMEYCREVGLSNSTLHRLEAGTQNITLDKLEVLCSKLGCDIVDLFMTEPEARGERPRLRRTQ